LLQQFDLVGDRADIGIGGIQRPGAMHEHPARQRNIGLAADGFQREFQAELESQLVEFRRVELLEEAAAPGRDEAVFVVPDIVFVVHMYLDLVPRFVRDMAHGRAGDGEMLVGGILEAQPVALGEPGSRGGRHRGRHMTFVEQRQPPRIFEL